MTDAVQKGTDHETPHPSRTVDRNTRGQIALYIGNDPDLFTSSFYDVGLIAYF